VSTSSRTRKDVTQLLADLSQGQPHAVDELLPLVYTELRRLAAHYMRQERPDHTLQATAVVHEAYLRLVERKHLSWQNRNCFVGVAAQVMRQILVDYARSHEAGKRGGGQQKVSLDEAIILAPEGVEGVTELDKALAHLEAMDLQQARIVELRFFGGMTVEETAALLGISPATVKREWSLAKAWLRREIKKSEK
jgi:RNA polymerase sigma factor (TIGR02999 family)